MGPSLTPRRGQRGFGLTETVLALTAISVAAAGFWRLWLAERRVEQAQLEAQAVQLHASALGTYVQEQWAQLQAGQPVTKAGTSLPAGAADGQTMAPTVAQLIAMGYLPNGFSATAPYTTGAFRARLGLTPPGCAGLNCNIEGLAWLDRPIVRRDTGEVDSLALAAMMRKVGVDAGLAPPADPANVYGNGGSWTLANPTPAAGTFGVRFGAGSSGWSSFLRVADSRDPNFQGPVSVRGDLAVGATPCVRLLAGGTVQVDCAGVVNATTGNFSGAVSSGSTTTGALSATGAATLASTLSVGGAVTTTSDVNAAGAISVGNTLTALGRISGQRLQPTGSYSPGAACADNNAVAGNVTGSGLVLCSGGLWRPIVTQAVAGAGCGPEGSLATADGVALLCSGAVYVPLARFASTGTAGGACSTVGVATMDAATSIALVCRLDRLGGAARWYAVNDLLSNWVEVGRTAVADGGVIAKPLCESTPGSSGTPAIHLTPFIEGSTNSTFDRYVVDGTSSWTVYLRDSTGAVLGGAIAAAQTYCVY